MPAIIGVEKSDIATSSMLNSEIPRAGSTCVSLKLKRRNTRILGKFGRYLPCGIGGLIVDNYKFPIDTILSHHGTHCVS